MRRVTLPWGMVLCTLVLTACGGGAPGATQTAIVLVVGASPLTILATEVPPTVTAMPPTAPNTEPATATLPPVPTATAGTAQPGLPSASGDPLLRTYRSLVAIQMNAALVAEALGQVQAGRVGPDEMPVAALAIGAMTQAVDESLPSVTPPASVKAQWEAAVAPPRRGQGTRRPLAAGANGRAGGQRRHGPHPGRPGAPAGGGRSRRGRAVRRQRRRAHRAPRAPGGGAWECV